EQLRQMVSIFHVSISHIPTPNPSHAAPMPRRYFIPMYRRLVFPSPHRNRFTLSRLNVEHAVNTPMNPVLRKNAVCSFNPLLAIHPSPSKKEPIRFTNSVPRGNLVGQRAETNATIA